MFGRLPLPSNVSTGSVVGRFGVVEEGTGFQPVTDLVVTFEPSVSAVLVRTADPAPLSIALTPVECLIDADGYLRGPDGLPGVQLVATDDDDLTPSGWTYRVEFVRDDQRIFQSFSIAIPGGTSIDITNAAPVPGSTGVGLDPAEAAQVAAVAAASSAAASASAAAADALASDLDASEAAASANAAAATVDYLDANVTAAAVAAVAASSTVTSAAAAAATAAVAAQGLIAGHVYVDDGEAIWALVDPQNRRSWIEVSPTGGLTVHTVAMINAATAANVTALALASIADQVAARGLVAGATFVDDSEAIWAVVDPQSRRSWIEIAPDGGLTAHTKTVIAAGIGPALVSSIPNQLVQFGNGPGLARATVDENGVLAEDAIGMDGCVPQWVLDRWAVRMSITVPVVSDPTAIVLPSAISVAVGATYKLLPSHYVAALSADHHVKTYAPTASSTSYTDSWRVAPVAAGSYSLDIDIFDRAGGVVTSKTITVTARQPPAGTYRHMAIGDSITRNGEYARTAASLLTGTTTCGTRTYDNGALCVEGRGGWRMSNYFTSMGSITDAYSPFLFPAGVPGAKFLGCSDFWKAVCYTDTAGYGLAGFAKIAKGWSGSSFLFDSSGYPVTPTEGDVIYDPQLAPNPFRQYTSGAWAAMSPQPAVEFDFSKYMLRFAAAFPNGGPTTISVMLGTNDFYSTVPGATSLAAFKTQMDAMISSIRVWSATVPFIIITPGVGGLQDYWNAAGNINSFEFANHMRALAAYLFEQYDTSAARANHVYVTSFLGAIDDANVPDTVHPNNTGHAQAGPWLSGAILQALGA